MTSAARLAVFTICSNNYLPFARVLLDSVRRHHPAAALFLCLADRRLDAPGAYEPGWTVVEAQDLPVPDFPGFAFRYDIMEFNTALKPFMFLHLTDTLGFGAAIYLDPDIELFAPMAPVLAALGNGASFVFTPHLCAPCQEPEEPNDLSMLRAGAYNLGFLGVSRTEETAGVLAWWARRLRHQCVNAQAEGLFVDQKFMDLVPGFAPGAFICHDTTLNVAYWNLPQRRLAREGDGWTVDGAPLTFFHFSGFDPRDPARLSRHDGRFVGALPEALQSLTAHYAARLLAEGHGQAPAPPYAYGRFRSGIPIPAVVRRMFRDGPPWEGDPFEDYQAFLDEPAPGAPPAVPGQAVTNLMGFLHGAVPPFRPLPGLPSGTRRDLRDPAHAEALVRWFVNDAADEFDLDPALVEPATIRLGALRPPPRTLPARPQDGDVDATVTAPLRQAGDAQRVGRSMFGTLLGAGVATEMLDGTSLAIQGRGPAQILCLGPDRLADAGLADTLARWAARSPDDAVRILVPVWHLARFPEATLAALDAAVHEVWAPSRFLQLVLAGRIRRPVIHMPVAVEPELAGEAPGRAGGQFVVVAPFDAQASWDRNDPRLAIEAFRQAFPARGTARLLLECRDGLAPGQRTELAAMAGNDPDIVLPDGKPGTAMASCHAVLALHRSEGVGLSVAEAMLMGRPVVATACAAHRELVTGRTGYPVDHRMVPAGPGQAWADPDLGHAAWLLRHLRDAPQQAAPLVAEAGRHVQAVHGTGHVAALQADRVRMLREAG